MKSKVEILEGKIAKMVNHALLKFKPTLNESLNDLIDLKDKLQKYGYNVSIPSGADFVFVSGIGKGHFNAKKAKAASILTNLKNQGFNAEMKLDPDGYYDFKVFP